LTVGFRILILFFLSNQFNLIDENRLTLTYMISNLLYEESFSFPIELLCIELIYLVASIGFEVCLWFFEFNTLKINFICRLSVFHVTVLRQANVCFVFVFSNVIKYK